MRGTIISTSIVLGITFILNGAWRSFSEGFSFSGNSKDFIVMGCTLVIVPFLTCWIINFKNEVEHHPAYTFYRSTKSVKERVAKSVPVIFSENEIDDSEKLIMARLARVKNEEFDEFDITDKYCETSVDWHFFYEGYEYYLSVCFYDLWEHYGDGPFHSILPEGEEKKQKFESATINYTFDKYSTTLFTATGDKASVNSLRTKDRKEFIALLKDEHIHGSTVFLYCKDDHSDIINKVDA